MLPPLVRASASDRWPSAGLPMASDRTIVSGWATGWIVSLPVAIRGRDRPAARGLAADVARLRRLDEADGRELVEPATKLRVERPRRDRRDDGIRRPPPELLGDLERHALRALGVVRAQVHVDDGPALELIGQLEAEPVDDVVRPVDAGHPRPERLGLGDLCRLEVGRDEDHRPQAVDRGGCGDRCGEVAGGGARQGVEAELASASRRDRHVSVLEREGRIAGIVLDPQPSKPQPRGKARRRDEWREADGQVIGGQLVDRQQLGEAPERSWPRGDRLAAERPGKSGVVVGRLERPEASVAHEAGAGWSLGATGRAAEPCEAGDEG